MLASSKASLSTLALLLVCAAQAQQRVTSPLQEFGHIIGADYVLPNYQQLAAYWRKLDRESDRMQLTSIGRTEEGREQLMAIVSSPANLRRLQHYKGIAQRLARAEGLTEADARKLAQEGKAVVWIDGGLHSNEVLGPQQLMETLYQMISKDDAETKRILNDVIILFVHANPDGMDLVSNWYMRNPEPTKRSIENLPRLYQKYIGHDNNRDFYMSTQAETKNMNRAMYREWFPQVMYNHHQTGPRGTVLFVPPFRPPFNHHVDPLVMNNTDMVGIAMQDRFIRESKPGAATRTGAGYSAWWNGGLRTTAYFHNIIGILTETIGSPNPMQIPFVADRQIMSGDILFPIEPQEWKFRQSVDYSVTANMAILDLASRRRDEFLYGIYRMGRNAIDKGRRDTWTNYPSRVAKAVAQAGRNPNEAHELLRAPALRDAKAYIIPANQTDFPTAVKFVNTLIENGISIHRATAPFSHGGTTFPTGSFVVRADQAFRPHVLDMFEPQDHPNDIPAPGSPPTPPYDNAGWTLAFQMGVDFVRVLDPLTAQLQPVQGLAKPPTGLEGPAGAAGFLLPVRQNDSFTALSRVLSAREKAFRAPSGDFWVPATPRSTELLQIAARDLGVNVSGAPQPAARTEVRAPRVGLWDRYGGSMPSGWIRWMLEKWDIPFKLVFAPELDAASLKDRYDVLIFPDGAIPASVTSTDPAFPAGLPEDLRPMWGRFSVDKTLPALRSFMEQGGTVITIGSSTNLAYHLKLPIESALVDEQGRALGRAKYYVPGSVLRVKVDNTLPISAGLNEHVDVMFDESPVFRFKPGATGLRRIAWFDSDTPLRSGWAWGQSYLKDGVAAAEATVGQGKLYLFGPEITFRAQPHGTFKFLFNGIFLSSN